MFENTFYTPILNQIVQMVNENNEKEEQDELELQNLFEPAIDEYITILRNIGVPAKVLDFYKYSSPKKIIESGELVQLYDISSILQLNLAATPGMYLVPHSFLVIGQYITGDGICIKRYERREDEDSSVYIAPVSGDFDTESQIDEILVEVADTFGDFLTKFVTDELPYDYDDAKDDE